MFDTIDPKFVDFEDARGIRHSPTCPVTLAFRAVNDENAPKGAPDTMTAASARKCGCDHGT